MASDAHENVPAQVMGAPLQLLPDSDKVLNELDALEPAYLRRRTLMDGPDSNAPDYVAAQAEALGQRLGDQAASLFDAAVTARARLKRVTLNSVARLALARGQWDVARHLAGEVVARDHHDLVAQRIIDASYERSPTLETEVDRWLASRRCNAPFDQIETRVNRSVHFCCSAWQPVPIGRIDSSDGGDFWTSAAAAEIRRSVTEGDFTHCSRWHCPAIATRRLPHAPARAQAGGVLPKPLVPAAPRRVILSHDRSCNLACPSCRNKLILMDHAASDRLDDMVERCLLPLLESAKQIKVTGSGDPFGSRHFRSVLKSLCRQQVAGRRIQLHTNGLLASERAWNELGLWDKVSSVWVSVDAADEATYAELRRGGSFAQLLPALRFLGTLRAGGAIDSLRLDFVVQAVNFDEMGDFVDLAQRVGADGVYFLRLRNWGNQSAEAFRRIDVCDQAHPEYPLLLRRLTDPRLAQAHVDLGSLATLRRVAGPTLRYA